jgi:hypothetical protein
VKRPAFQFYTGDWQGNAKLKRCTHAERGIWIAVLCLMHDSEEYGAVRWPLADVAQAVGCKLSELKSLRTKGVLKGADVREQCEAYVYRPRHAGKEGDPVTLIEAQPGPIWYSSRMVRDEYVRTKRGIGTRFGETPKPPSGDSPKPPFGDGPTSSSSSSTSKTVANNLPTGTRAAATAVDIHPLKNLPAALHAAIRRALAGVDNPQEVADELDGMAGVKRLQDPMAMLKDLIEQKSKGTFVPSHAHVRAAEREQELVARELEEAGRDPQGRRATA